MLRDDNIYLGTGTILCNPYTVGLKFNQWQCIALTRNSGGVRFWINGVCKAGPTTWTQTVQTGAQTYGWFSIGCMNCYQRMNGRVAEVVVVKGVGMDMASAFATLPTPAF